MGKKTESADPFNAAIEAIVSGAKQIRAAVEGVSADLAVKTATQVWITVEAKATVCMLVDNANRQR